MIQLIFDKIVTVLLIIGMVIALPFIVVLGALFGVLIAMGILIEGLVKW